jgi:hypothetical protein
MKKMSRLIFSTLVIACLCGVVLAQDDNILKQSHPDRYIVKKGDTLWDIASLFLHKPWLWPEIWQINPQIANPHLIYPGDELELVYLDGKPYLRMKSGSARLSPRIRETPWDGAIPTIPVDAIAPFLSQPYVVNEGQLDAAPYVVAFAPEHIIAGAGQRIYVRSIDSDEYLKYDIIRAGDAYRDAETGEILGYEGLYIGTGKLQRTGDPATLLINIAEQEVLEGDGLLPAVTDEGTGNFHPREPAQQVDGAIISVLNGVSQIGQYHIVVLDRGSNDGLSPGTVLQVDHRGETVPDKVARSKATFLNRTMWEKVTLPDEPAGLLMVFRTFERVSFGIIMDAKRTMHVNDKVHNP